MVVRLMAVRLEWGFDMNPVRVNKQHPCPICGKDSWCLVGTNHVFCMRATSPNTRTFSDGSIAYLHPVGESAPKLSTREEPRPVMLDVRTVLHEWERYRRPGDMGRLAESLGVSQLSLEMLGCAKAPQPGTWAFPMRTGDGTFCGIRLRRDNGDKWAERGSHQGLFLPQGQISPVMLIAEGPTDTAAAITLGYSAIGRPSCSGGIHDVQMAVARLQVRMAVIVADLDEPGIRGAKTLQEHLPIPTAILLLPAKDLRSAVRSGIDKATLDSMIASLLWRRPH